MAAKHLILIGLSLGLGACATNTDTPNNFAAERTVFGNPYVAPELDRRLVGPYSPDDDDERGNRRWRDGLLYPGAGDIAYDQEGNRVQLSRRDQRELQKRYFANQAQAVQDARIAEFNAQQAELPPPPPQPSAPPVAQDNPHNPPN